MFHARRNLIPAFAVMSALTASACVGPVPMPMPMDATGDVNVFFHNGLPYVGEAQVHIEVQGTGTLSFPGGSCTAPSGSSLTAIFDELALTDVEGKATVSLNLVDASRLGGSCLIPAGGMGETMFETVSAVRVSATITANPTVCRDYCSGGPRPTSCEERCNDAFTQISGTAALGAEELLAYLSTGELSARVTLDMAVSGD